MFFPVFHPGALFGFGNGHAAMADGEVTQTGLETSMAVDFSVDVIRGYQTQQVREEDGDYIITFGVAGSLQEALKVSTAQLATWIKHDYGLTDSEVALFLGVEMKYEVTELVDPEFNVVSKVPKRALAMLMRQTGSSRGKRGGRPTGQFTTRIAHSIAKENAIVHALLGSRGPSQDTPPQGSSNPQYDRQPGPQLQPGRVSRCRGVLREVQYLGVHIRFPPLDALR
jgi:hypothetical protein